MGRESDLTDAEPKRDEGDDHLADVEDGCGCVEVWEHLADRRRDD